MPSTFTQQRARVASLTRYGAPEAKLAAARADMRAEWLAEHIAKLVDAAPELTDEQRARLAALLTPAGSR